MPSSKRSNRRRKKEGGEEKRTFRPRLSDFKRKSGEGEDNRSISRSVDTYNMTRRGRPEERSLRARHMDNIFEDFRNNIESILNPWSSYLWRSPSKRGIEEEEQVMTRIPLYDMVYKGDRYEIDMR
jgi:hypothetical protein